MSYLFYNPDNYDILAASEDEAKKRFELYKNTDPYPLIQPALLNSADILAYVKATSLIYPFDLKRLKGASYDVPIKGKVIFWNPEDKDKTKPHEVTLDSEEKYFDLLPNAIAFVTLEPTFRIPSYLALRFNLKIKHIYKGLLLGTGPLVDPCFVGKLSIPLHNLTRNTYRFHGGEELITLEFTKMSCSSRWNPYPYYPGHHEVYIENPIPQDRTVLEYVRKALTKDDLPNVISSIPEATETAKNAAKKAEQEVKKTTRFINVQTIATIIAVVGVVAACMAFSIDAINKANDRYTELFEQYCLDKKQYQEDLSSLKNQIGELKIKIDEFDSVASDEKMDNSITDSNH